MLETIEQEDLIARATTMGAYLRQQLEMLQQRYEAIGEVRVEGLLIGVELVKDRPFQALGAVTTERCFELGLSMNIRRRPDRGSVWRIAPPLTVSKDEIDRAIAILDEALRDGLDEVARGGEG